MHKFLFQTLPLRAPDDPAAAAAVDPPAGLPPAASDPATSKALGVGDPNNAPGNEKAAEGKAPEAEKTLTPEEQKAKDEADKKSPAPFEVAKDLTLPENFKWDNDEQSAQFQSLVNEAGVSKEIAQKFFDFGAEALKASGAAGTAAWEKTQTDWQNEVKADPELGDPQGLKPEVKASLGKMLDMFGGLDTTPEGKKLRENFTLTGAGNNPAIVKFLYNVSKQITEGGSVKGNPSGQSAQRPSHAEAMWPEPKG